MLDKDSILLVCRNILQIKPNQNQLKYLYLLYTFHLRLIFTLNQVIANGYNSISEQDKYWDIEIGLQVYTGIIHSNTEFDLYFENEENETYPLNDIKEFLFML